MVLSNFNYLYKDGFLIILYYICLIVLMNGKYGIG